MKQKFEFILLIILLSIIFFIFPISLFISEEVKKEANIKVKCSIQEYDLLQKYHELVIKNKEVKKENDYLHKLISDHYYIIETMKDHRLNEYDKETNNCYQQSQRMQNKLLDKGIQSSIFINEDGSHAWLGIWVETTDGSFTVLGNQSGVREIRDNNSDIICN